MKKIFISILAIAALAACAKTGVEYSDPAEIGFAPAKNNITKAEGLSGALASTQKLGVWAYWDKDGAIEDNGVSNYGNYDDAYLVNALFAQKTVNNVTAWGGTGNGYPWPLNGSLVFAGYTTPGTDVLGTGAVSYVLASDTMTFTDYVNTNEFDLCWFGRTENSYNYRANGTAVPATLSHALTWITVQVYAEGSPVNNWTITSMSLANVVTKGTATCVGTKATWSSPTTAATTSIYTGSHTLSTSKTKLTDNVIIPSAPLQLTVNFSFNVNGVPKTDSKTVSLKLDEDNSEWQNGVHYTYTLLFKGNEILVAPSYSAWGTSTLGDITVGTLVLLLEAREGLVNLVE